MQTSYGMVNFNQASIPQNSAHYEKTYRTKATVHDSIQSQNPYFSNSTGNDSTISTLVTHWSRQNDFNQQIPLQVTFDKCKQKDFRTQLHRPLKETNMDSFAKNLSADAKNPCRLMRPILRTTLRGQLQ